MSGIDRAALVALEVWIVSEFDGGGIRGVYLSQSAAAAGILEIRRDHPDLRRRDFIIQSQRIRGAALVPPVEPSRREEDQEDGLPVSHTDGSTNQPPERGETSR